MSRPAVTGTELYVRRVCSGLPRVAPDIDWRFYSSAPATEPGGVDLTVAPLPRLWTELRLPLEVARNRPDLLFVPAHSVPSLVRVPSVMTVHDLAYERFPGAYSRSALAHLRHGVRSAARRCRLLLAVSEATKRDLMGLYGVSPDLVRVVHPGPGSGPGAERVSDPERDARELAGIGIHGPFVLHVGRVEVRKNQVTALAAVEAIDGLTLVCAGPVADREVAARLTGSAACIVLGRVGDPVRDLLYRTAQALVFPSLYEGFGFPVLEAMARGLPVITARTSSLPEIAGDAALYVDDPLDHESLGSAIRSVLEGGDLRERLAAAGRLRAARFTWESCSVGVAAALREALER